MPGSAEVTMYKGKSDPGDPSCQGGDTELSANQGQQVLSSPGPHTLCLICRPPGASELFMPFPRMVLLFGAEHLTFFLLGVFSEHLPGPWLGVAEIREPNV